MRIGAMGSKGGFGSAGVLGRASGPALLNLNDRIVFFGNSYVANGFAQAGNLVGFQSAGFTSWSQAVAQSKLYAPIGANLGVAGNTVAQELARINTVTALNPKCVLGDFGTNDISAVSSSANQAAQDAAFASITSTITSIYSGLFAGGAQYVVDQTIIPRAAGSTLAAPQENVRQRVNAWKLAQAGARLKVVNAESLAPWTVGNGLQSDGLHPDTIGAFAIGQACGAVLAAITNSADILGSAINAYSPNPTMAGTSGTRNVATGTVATGWLLDSSTGGGVGCDGSVVTIDGRRWQVMTLSGSNSGTGKYVQMSCFIPATMAAGDVLELIYEAEAESLVGVTTLYGQMFVFDGSFNTLLQSVSMFASDNEGYPTGTKRMTLRTPPFAVATGTPVNFEITFTALLKDTSAVSGILRIGRNCARKVPAGA